MAFSLVFVAATGVSMMEESAREERINKAQEKAATVEGATRAYEARKSRRQQIREARVREAEVENVAAQTGQQGSSAAVAASDSISAQLGSNIGSINTALATGSAKTAAEMDIFEAGKSSDLSRVAGITASVAGSKIPRK